MNTREALIYLRCRKLYDKKKSTAKTRSCISKHRREYILKRDGNNCLCCGSKENLTIDHIVPVSMGGCKRRFNLQTLCGKCNNEKANRIICYIK